MITSVDHLFHSAYAALDLGLQFYLSGCIEHHESFDSEQLLEFSDEVLVPLLAIELRAAIGYLPQGSAPDALRRLATDAAENRLFGGGFVQLLSGNEYLHVTGYYGAGVADVPCGCALGSLTIGSCLDGYTGPISEQIYLGLIAAAEVQLASRVREALYGRMLTIEHIAVTLYPGQVSLASNPRRRGLIQAAAETVLAQIEATTPTEA